MNPGEEFEKRCYEYLQRIYGTKNSKFEREGGMDSTKSDIAVYKDDTLDFYIEAKDSPAQSGQFVVLPNETTKTFVFSPRNHSEPNEMTDIMIEYMNRDFDKYNNAGTSGEQLDINTDIFAGWIVEHYKDKNVKYFISHEKDYVILPIRKFAAYFDVIAKYRIKKSGSSDPASKDIQELKAIVKQIYPSANFSISEKKLFITLNEKLTQERFQHGDYTYFFSTQDSPNLYRLKRLSNTYNMNVIFSIELKKEQDAKDLEEFEKDL